MLRQWLRQLLTGLLLLIGGMILVTLGAHWALWIVLPALLLLLLIQYGPL